MTFGVLRYETTAYNRLALYGNRKSCLIGLFLYLDLNVVVATAGGNSVCVIDLGSGPSCNPSLNK